MFKFNSVNIVVCFSPLARGNFVRCALTLADFTADASLKATSLDDRLARYILNTQCKIQIRQPWPMPNLPLGPGHADNWLNFEIERFNQADSADIYVHCGHHNELPAKHSADPQKNKLMIPLANKKIVVITVQASEIPEIKSRVPLEQSANTDFELRFFGDRRCLDHYVGGPYYELAYADLLVKNKFLDHCLMINPYCKLELIAEYYDFYFQNSGNFFRNR